MFIVLSDQSPDILKDIRAMQYRFMCDGKGEKIKRNIHNSTSEDGGVKTQHI